jgi:hypothetical protein
MHTSGLGLVVGVETIPGGADGNGRIGYTITVDDGVTTVSVPTVQFFEHDALNVISDARLAQASQNAGDLRRGRGSIYRVHSHRIKVDQDFL